MSKSNHTLEVLYDNGKSYKVTGLTDEPEISVGSKGEFLTVRYIKDNMHFTVEIPTRDVAATKYTVGAEINLRRFKPCALITAEITKLQR